MLFVLFAVAGLAAAKLYNSPPYANYIQTRRDQGLASGNTSSLEVDLGYSIYRGVSNATTNLNTFKSIRYAKAPIGPLRWQAPRSPAVNRTTVIPASEFASKCPQAPDASSSIQAVNQSGASEDCLFLSVYSPNNATSYPLPVLVWIHGGGYGAGDGTQDLSPIINTNENRFIGVAIQYRLGAFGFLSSDEVFRKGVVNAGILDQHMSLHWVQQYIHLFGGDPNKVTIFGESAGGGSVMLQDMAYGGSLGSQLFQNTIAASPYLPMQYGYKDWVPSQAYYSFASRVGCDSMKPCGANNTVPTFECLLNVKTEALINASATISQSGTYGTWAFLPVTDDVFVQNLPSRQLARNQINGVNALIGNNANEGPAFVPQTIKTEDDLVAWLRLTFPLFTNNDIAKILLYYPSTNASVDPNQPLFATTGDSGPTALNISGRASSQQQRANNIYAETTFVCPSYWMTEAYSNNAVGGQAYKYQFSVEPALHGYDVASYFATPGSGFYSYDFDVAFQNIIGNFVVGSNPSISSQIANGLSASNTTMNATNPASEWPPFSVYEPMQINLNATCEKSSDMLGPGMTLCGVNGDQNRISLVNAYTWEGGRGIRCDFWRAMGELVPE